MGTVVAPARLLLLPLLLGVAVTAASQEREIQRAIIQRDQQSAEFARPGDRSLENLHAQQLRDAGRALLLNPDPEAARQLLPYERERMARDSEQIAPPSEASRPREAEKPLPLPGGPRHGVEPIPPPSIGG